jgi:hypothetical protein
MSDFPTLYVRVVSLPAPDGPQPERHAYRDVSGHLAVPICTLHTVLTEELRPDDPSVQTCPLCAVFLMAGELDVDRLAGGADWNGL